MELGISDIQKTQDGKVEISFCTYPDCEERLKLIISERTIKEIADFAKSKLNYQP